MSRPPAPSPLARRTILAGGWAGALAALTGSALVGCRSGAPAAAPPPTPTPDEVLRRRAVARIKGLQDAVTTVASPATLRAVLARQAAAYTAQLTALGEPPASAAPTGTATSAASPAPGGPTGTTGSASGASSGSASPAPVPPTPAGILAAQAAAATEALTDCLTARAPGMAVLLARLAAAHAAGADLLAAAARLPGPGEFVPGPATAGGTAGPTTAATGAGGQASSTGTGGPASLTGGSRPASPPSAAGSASPTATGQVAPLARLLQGEHAAVYAYGVVAAWVAPPQRDQAHADWDAHLGERDELVQVLTAAGVSAPAASAGYDLGTPPDGGPAAVRLAATVEGRLAALAAAVVGATADGARPVAAGVLVAAARRQVGWTSTLDALPGGP